MKSIAALLVAIGTVITMAGCSYTPSALVGTYSIEENGRLADFIRVEKQGDKLLMSDMQNGRWSTPVAVVPLSKVDFEAFAKVPITVKFSGLRNEQVALVHVPIGWKMGAFESTTGFWLASVLGPIPLHKK